MRPLRGTRMENQPLLPSSGRRSNGSTRGGSSGTSTSSRGSPSSTRVSSELALAGTLRTRLATTTRNRDQDHFLFQKSRLEENEQDGQGIQEHRGKTLFQTGSEQQPRIKAFDILIDVLQGIRPWRPRRLLKTLNYTTLLLTLMIGLGSTSTTQAAPREDLDRDRRALPGLTGAIIPTVPFTAGNRKSTRLNSSHITISYAVF